MSPGPLAKVIKRTQIVAATLEYELGNCWLLLWDIQRPLLWLPYSILYVESNGQTSVLISRDQTFEQHQNDAHIGCEGCCIRMLDLWSMAKEGMVLSCYAGIFRCGYESWDKGKRHPHPLFLAEGSSKGLRCSSIGDPKIS